MARGFNKAIIIGNLARDPEIRYTAGGKAMARITVAVNRQWRGQSGEVQEEVDFIPAVIWGKMAENCDRYLRKGSAVLVEGRISVRSFEGRDGQRKYVTEIVVDFGGTVQFLGGGRRDEGGSDSSWNRGGAEKPSDDGYGRSRQPQQSQPRQEPAEAPQSLRESGFGGNEFPMDFSEVEEPDSPGDEEDIPF